MLWRPEAVHAACRALCIPVQLKRFKKFWNFRLHKVMMLPRGPNIITWTNTFFILDVKIFKRGYNLHFFLTVIPCGHVRPFSTLSSHWEKLETIKLFFLSKNSPWKYGQRTSLHVGLVLDTWNGCGLAVLWLGRTIQRVFSTQSEASFFRMAWNCRGKILSSLAPRFLSNLSSPISPQPH